jgi:hypothetical protein
LSAVKLVRAAFLAALFLLPATCARQPRRGEPGVGCSLASCCYGWMWKWMMGCTPAHPPDCGCVCQQSPNLYGSKEECEADHPPATSPRDAGLLAPR